MVSDVILYEGGEEAAQYIRRQLAHQLADFILASKLLDGSDASGFQMERDLERGMTRVTVRCYVLTPNEMGRHYPPPPSYMQWGVTQKPHTWDGV